MNACDYFNLIQRDSRQQTVNLPNPHVLVDAAKEWPEEEIEQTAEAVGYGAVK